MKKIDVYNYKKYRDGAENDVMARVCHVNYVIDGINELGSYELGIDTTGTVEVSTRRGVIDITGMDMVVGPPDPAFASSKRFFINNPALDLTIGNRDNVYVQFSVYYSPAIDDNVIPYVIASGITPSGLELTIYNASPNLPGTGGWQGAFYVYYELYTK